MPRDSAECSLCLVAFCCDWNIDFKLIHSKHTPVILKPYPTMFHVVSSVLTTLSIGNTAIQNPETRSKRNSGQLLHCAHRVG